jgi:magnesium chelatase subunit D
MLLAVDPKLKGLLIKSPPGTGKTILARSFESILPESDRCSTRFEGGTIGVSAAPGAETESSSARAARPFVEVPIGVTEDMLLGGADLAWTLGRASRRVSSGLLARANGGFISIDHINLMDSVNLRHVLAALDSGVVIVERDGLSLIHEARFALIGTMDAWDAQTAAALRDRVGLIVEHYEAPSEADRGEIVDRAERFIRDPETFWEDFGSQTRELRAQVAEARSRLASVKIERSQMSRISSTALQLEIESSRADLFSVRAARASAALRGSAEVEEIDVIAAIEYVMLPRAGGQAHGAEAALDALAAGDMDRRNEEKGSQDDGASEAAFGLAQLPDTARFQGAKSGPRDDESEQGRLKTLDEMIVEPRDWAVPGELVDSGVAQRRFASKVGAKSGRRAEQAGSAHGRYVGAVPAAGRPQQGNRIAIDATLRAAAPHQRLRRAGPDWGPVIVKPGDLRFKRLKHRSGVLFIFLVDTSGSMALGRIGHAKGVMIRLLRQAYLKRDRVALMAFRGTSVQVVLEPTGSVDLARRAIAAMPAGGGTPLGAGLAGAIRLADRARKRKEGESVLLIFTDGRANVALQPMERPSRAERDQVIRAELEEMGQRLRDHEIRAVVIDTGSWDATGGRCTSISRALGAKYCRLQRSGSDGLYQQIRELAADRREL